MLDKLRSGKYPQQASLNLLRQPVEECRKTAFSLIQQALADGLRNVLIIHGKGRDDKSHANIVRSYVARWLTEFDDVQAYCTALPHHGGSGRVTSDYVKRRRRSKKTGSATLSAVVDLETICGSCRQHAVASIIFRPIQSIINAFKQFIDAFISFVMRHTNADQAW